MYAGIRFNHSTPTNLVIFSKDYKKTAEYPFRLISKEELIAMRVKREPGCVYKKGGKLFICNIPRDLRITDVRTSPHLCGKSCSQVCRGCPRTSSLTTLYQRRLGKNFSQAVIDSWRIEKFPFVKEGIESFNVDPTNEAFLVIECEHYKQTT